MRAVWHSTGVENDFGFYIIYVSYQRQGLGNNWYSCIYYTKALGLFREDINLKNTSFHRR